MRIRYLYKTLCVQFFFLLSLFAACAQSDEQPRTYVFKNGGAGSMITVTIGSKVFSATLYDNEATKSFVKKLPLTVMMSDLNANEKYAYLSEKLPVNAATHGTIRRGDIMLYGSNCLVLFYETFRSSYSYTRIGYVNDPDAFAAALGSGAVSVTFSAQ